MKFYTGRLCPEVQPLILLYTIFGRKESPFVYLLLKNGIPLTYLVENFVSLLKAYMYRQSIEYERITNQDVS